MDWERHILIGLAAGVVVATLAVVAAGNVARDEANWRRIVPSPLHWFAFVGSALFALLLGYVRLFVGSGLPDADRQMTMATGLAAAFAIGAIVTAQAIFAIRRQAVRWRNDQIAFRDRGTERQVPFSEVVGLRSDWRGRKVLTLADGTTLRLDNHATGMQHLVRELADRVRELEDRELFD